MWSTNPSGVGFAACQCAPGYTGASCSGTCPHLDGQVCSGHGLCAMPTSASAVCICSSDPQSGYWQGERCDSCAAGWAGEACTQPCLTGSNGYTCSGHGECLPTGSCSCQDGYCSVDCSVVPGLCAGAGDLCPAGYYGSQCEKQCGCGSHGTCSAGYYGTGACACDLGWTGADCSLQCEGGAECVMQFTCDPLTAKCVCPSGMVTTSGGGLCSTPCPGPAADPCNGHGVCNTTAQCTCNAGYGGPECSLRCPHDAWGKVCSGHGACQGGACACDGQPAQGHWGGLSCDACAPGYFGASCEQVCVMGVSADQQCVCDTGWAHANCSARCPDGSQGVCSGHGLCDDGNLGSGTCLCQPGYAGADCALTCPGGVDGPCSGHGLCDPSGGACACLDAAAGRWGGPDCSTCKDRYFGPACNLTCPRVADGLTCSGHGSCTFDGRCLCGAAGSANRWAGSLCDKCLYGFFGAGCGQVCPGGSCNVCSGHGTCHSGLAGNGTCRCDAAPSTGHWVGRDCAQCQSGYYSEGCTRQCPGFPDDICSGHGYCLDGRYSTGACVCFERPEVGSWAGLDCGECARGFYGPRCAEACPGGAAVPCSGHGACADGRQGAGTCLCTAGYVGDHCEYGCPRVDGEVCGGHGGGSIAAEAQGSLCQCAGDSRQGYWGTGACTDCLLGYWGPSWLQTCPGLAAGAICGGHGECDGGVRGSGDCLCDPWWVGADCSAGCPGVDSGLLCGGHGGCQAGSADCTCNDSARGHWAGPRCSQCAGGWSGAYCTLPCPLNNQTGVECSGSGVCESGVCRPCKAGTCGQACEVIDGCTPCPAGFWGLACAQTCPGVGTAGGLCGGHGFCDDGSHGTGRCVCDLGYGGGECGVVCPGGAANPCGGRGQCSIATALCLCDIGWFGPGCGTECSNGRMTMTLSMEWLCTCDAGYAGPGCSVACPGGATNPCSGRGACSLADGTCVCGATYGGDDCSGCAQGWFGDDCSNACYHGLPTLTPTPAPNQDLVLGPS